MENDKFQLLTTVLESMKYEDMNHSNLKNAITKVIDRFGKYLDENQKKEVLHEFHHEKIKQERDTRRENINEDEKQRELLQRFISGEQFSW